MFDIRFNGTIMGNANVKQKGLYYYINCTCKLPNRELYRVVMYDKSFRKDLGICVPHGDEFTISTRVPAKCFQGDVFTFELVREAKGEYVISDNMHFTHLDKLETARLYVANGQPRLIID